MHAFFGHLSFLCYKVSNAFKRFDTTSSKTERESKRITYKINNQTVINCQFVISNQTLCAKNPSDEI